MYVTQENNRQNIQLHSVQKGYPGGCGTPKCAAAVASSPESSSPTDGPSVQKYTANVASVAVQNAAQSSLVKNFSWRFVPNATLFSLVNIPSFSIGVILYHIFMVRW